LLFFLLLNLNFLPGNLNLAEFPDLIFFPSIRMCSIQNMFPTSGISISRDYHSWGSDTQHPAEKRVGGTMSENNSESSGGVRLSWREQLRGIFGTPMGLVGVCITTIFFVLTVLGLIGHATGLIGNPYFVIITILLFPAGMMLGLLLIPLAGFIGRKKRQRGVLSGWRIDPGNVRHQKIIVLILVFSVVNIAFFTLVGYEGYRFMGSPAFCGVACHSVMAPEYVTHRRSPHAKVSCLQCHAAPGFNGFLQAKFSGLRRLEGILIGRYSRPIRTPVKDMPPATVICEKCHPSNRYSGSKTKTFVSFANTDQENPEHQEIILDVGGRNPVKDLPEGIHWHADAGMKIEYQPLDEKRTKIGTIRVTRTGGVPKEYKIPGGGDGKNISPDSWRTMDCTDCHNRTAHGFESSIERVDFGLNGNKIDPLLPGIREDSLTVLKKEYGSRSIAEQQITVDLIALQERRNGIDFVNTHRSAITDAGYFLGEAYQANIWPEMKITWGTYKNQIGHRYSKDGYGCFRCHDEKHATNSGETISQDCSLCHVEPE
jgi:hypothetical protein